MSTYDHRPQNRTQQRGLDPEVIEQAFRKLAAILQPEKPETDASNNKKTKLRTAASDTKVLRYSFDSFKGPEDIQAFQT